MATLSVVVVALLTTSNQRGSIEFPAPDWQTQPSDPIENSATTMPVSADSGVGGLVVTVHVIGQVKLPGVYQLDSPARVFDAVALAGGFTKKADQSSLNLARLVNDGEQIEVLETGQASASSNSIVESRGLINLNRASAAELDTLPGIGPTLAARIVDYRTSNGQFTSVQDLGKVAGIGRKLLASLQPLVAI